MANDSFGAVRTVTPTNLPWLPGLIERARRIDGQPPLSDGSLVGLATGGRTVLVIDEHAIALANFPEAELVVDPDFRRQGLGTALLKSLIAESEKQSESQGAAPLLLWAHGDHAGARALAAQHGFAAVRRLLHLRADVPDSPSAQRAPLTLANLESFRPETDDAQWLALNAVVFADHPEQGRVSQSDLEVLFAESWFEPEDFLLLRGGDGTLIGYCWLKVEGGNGEFYVVGVHPDSAGRGLGRVLVEAGLDRLRVRGIRSAHLYVEAENVAAVHLYRAYGFVDDTIDVQYARILPFSG